MVGDATADGGVPCVRADEITFATANERAIPRIDIAAASDDDGVEIFSPVDKSPADESSTAADNVCGAAPDGRVRCPELDRVVLAADNDAPD